MKRRIRTGEYNPLRDMGCIVSATLANGDPHVVYEPGLTLVALRAIVERLPAGAKIDAISTHRTILRDLQWPHRLQPFPPRHALASDEYAAPTPAVDPWAVERTMLTKIGRRDLLPERMTRQPIGQPVQPMRGGFYNPEAASRRRRPASSGADGD